MRILREHWGPASGKKAFSQRLFVVLFADKKTLTLVAEDVVDGFDEPFETNQFYSSILREWRLRHAAPPRPNAKAVRGRR